MIPFKRRAKRWTAWMVMALMLKPALGLADSSWMESGDLAMRLDLQLLNDAEVIRLPITSWPLPRAAVVHALAQAKEHFAVNAAVSAALARVRQGVGAHPGMHASVSLLGGEAGLLRDFDSLGRESGEASAQIGVESERYSAALRVTGVSDAEDGQTVRLDGSHATLRLGNWLLSANALDRWWGPGYDGSLILSNNARPMPGVLLERATALPFKWRFLEWLGPWRFSLGVSRMETERLDIDSPLFLAMRFTVMPFKDVEFGFLRTAQFCGEQLACDFSSITEMFIGNDNIGIDASAANEPGNQMAGFDIRWTSPIGNLPYAIYSQMIGEDESSYLPVKYLAQFGIEAWKPLTQGGIVHGFVEYADTTCSAVSSSGPYYNCAYNQTKFIIEGYRYRGRVIGHTTDADSRSLVIGANYTSADGDLWSLRARAAELNRDGTDGRNTVSPVATDYASLEFGWRGRLFGEQISIEAGLEATELPQEDRELQPYGFISWRHAF